VVANFHTVDGQGRKRSIPSSSADNFRASCLRNVLTHCAATPVVQQQGAAWVAMGDCNMSHEHVKIVVTSLRPAPSFVCTCTRKRDFIISSATLGDRGKEGAFLAWDQAHWSLVAPVYHHDAVPQRQHGQIDDSDQSEDSIFPDSDATLAIKRQAAQDVERHLKEQQKITEDALARQEALDRQEEAREQLLRLMQQEAAEQQSAHASSQQVCVDLIVECGPIVSMYSIELQQEYILFTCSHIQF
jgi:hypothetical protein